MKKKSFVLYRHFDGNDKLLYIGASENIKDRTSHHRNRSEWFDDVLKITLEHYKSRTELLDAEAFAVIAERPTNNKCDHSCYKDRAKKAVERKDRALILPSDSDGVVPEKLKVYAPPNREAYNRHLEAISNDIRSGKLKKLTLMTARNKYNCGEEICKEIQRRLCQEKLLVKVGTQYRSIV